MIRIPTYKEHEKGKAIFDRYLCMVAKVMPFAPEEVLCKDTLEVDGKVVTAGNFLEVSGKTPRKRTEAYTSLLEKELKDCKLYHICEKKSERFEQDRLLAARIIWKANRQLYDFLYMADDNVDIPKEIPPMNRENLRILLTAKMDELNFELRNLPKICKPDSSLLLKEIFRYDVFSESDEVIALLKDMDVTVCPYCNRQYTFTVSDEDGTSRPHFDHYKAKEHYPYFALSILNLVPSCPLCNNAKGDKEDLVLYPYSDEMGYHAMFQTEMITDFNYLFGDQNALDEFDVVLELSSKHLKPELAEKIENSARIFHLRQLYRQHKDYILYLFWKNYVFSEEYLNTIYAEFSNMFSSREEVKNLLYLMDIQKEHWGKRTLSKLTHDIDQEMR